jgi:hypothetical protein
MMNIETYIAKNEIATLFPTRETRSKSLKAIGIRPRGEYGMGATSEPAIQQAGADLLASLWTEVNTTTPDELGALRLAASNGDAMAKIRLEKIQQADNDAEEAIRRDKADIARDIEKYKTPYSFGVADGMSW